MAPVPKKAAPPLPPKPIAPVKSVAEEANSSLAAVKTGKDTLRPLKYLRKFIDGTFVEGLDSLAKYGRKGMWVGVGVGIVAAIATQALFPIFGLALAGFVIGAGGGAAKGFLLGGMHAVGRAHRGQLYADDLVVRKTTQDNASPNLTDNRAAYREQQKQDQYKAAQLLVRDREATDSFNTYWQDREAGRRNRLPQERGQGF